MQLIESKTLGSAQASIEFTNIPQDGTDLLCVMSLRRDAGDHDEVFIAFNSSTSSFSARQLYGSGSAVGSSTPARQAGLLPGANIAANTFSSGSIYIPNYSGSTTKSYSVESVTEANATTAYQNILAGLWSVTDPISSITFTNTGGNNFVSGSSASLYKITKGSDGTTTVA